MLANIEDVVSDPPPPPPHPGSFDSVDFDPLTLAQPGPLYNEAAYDDPFRQAEVRYWEEVRESCHLKLKALVHKWYVDIELIG